MTGASRILDKLNEPQQRAVQALGGPVLVLAGPGSGKTRVLTHRIAYLISEVGIDPHAILAVTFTNKAAKEMRERLHTLVGEELTKRLTVGTFHSVCIRFLRHDIEKLGWSKAIVEFAADDAQTHDALARLGDRTSVLVFDQGREQDHAAHRSRRGIAYRDSDALEQMLAGLARQPGVTLTSDPKQWLPQSVKEEAIRRGIITYRPDFTVYDDDDQTRLMRQVIKELNLDEKQYPPRAIHSAISRAKNELAGPAELAAMGRSYWDEIVARCFEAYQKRLQASNALDFDDLLGLTVRLFDTKPHVLDFYQKRYVHVLIDEYQDVNTVQYVFAKQISGHYRNLFAVGDEDQCVPAGGLVQTARGPVPIEQIVAGEVVLGGAGRGTISPAMVEKTRSRPYSGTIVRVTTAGGRVLEVTPNHMCFARLAPGMESYYVYLMYRRDKGYRIGLTRGYRSEGRRYGIINGLDVRVRQERADKAWILRVCSTREQAAFFEQFFAINYSIPTMIFDVAGRGDLVISQETVDRLYAAIDTRTNVQRLMDDLLLFEDYPHCQPYGASGSSRQDRMLVHLTAFGGHEPSLESPWYRHRVSLNTTSRVLEAQVVQEGIPTRPGQRDTWRVERVYKQMAQSAEFAEQMARAAGDLSIARWAKLSSGPKFAFQPASHLRPSMCVPVMQDGVIVEDVISSVEHVPYEGQVYDLDVANLHNYAVGGVVVHNSVYAFRGANMRYVLQFEDDFPDAKLILLEQNYRSTQAILDVAGALINASGSRKHNKRLWTENDRGVVVALREAYNEEEEARLVCDEIERLRAKGDAELSDCAVLYRTNAQSRALEEAFLTRSIRYRLVGGVRFYERKEIKDMLAYLRIISNPFDSVSLERILEATPGIGRQTIATLTAWATGDLGVPVYPALQLLGDESEPVQSPLNARARTALVGFLHLIDELIRAKDERGLVELMDVVLERSRFHDALQREHGDEEGENRWENVLELRTVASQYSNLPREAQLPTFLEEVALVAATDDLATEQNSVTLITMHQAKGLEYANVFIVGLEEGLLPHSRSLEDPEQLEEERRLLYVASTRAQQRLFLYYAFKRRLYGRENIATPSRFLADIPKEMLQRREQRQRETSAFGQSSMFTGRSSFGSRPATAGQKTRAATSWGSTAKKNTTPLKPAAAATFSPGQKVRHAQFGEGIVISSAVKGDDEEVTVAFVGQGVKRLLAAFAKLEKV